MVPFPPCDGALGYLIWWVRSLPRVQGLELDDLYSPFQPKPFHESMGRGNTSPHMQSQGRGTYYNGYNQPEKLRGVGEER